jgi:3-hydroxyisobutyrate dehydrogenase
MTMVPEGSHVKSVYLDAESGICNVDLEHKILIDCSTIDLATSLEVKERITASNPNASFYDGPCQWRNTRSRERNYRLLPRMFLH